MVDTASHLKGIIAFVDVVDDGELIKETFDVEYTPSVIFVKEGLMYFMPSAKQITWTAKDLIDFAEVNHVNERNNYLR
jgi:hypothetical protein